MNAPVPRPHPPEPSTQIAAPPPPDLDDPRVVRALEEYQAALDAGRRPARSEFLVRHADVAEALAECLDGLDLVRSAASDLAPVPLTETAPEALGDFRILREIGRGGMGVVYEAEQVSLRRRVALKVLPAAAALDARQLRRFRNEAEAAALLQHPHVVPVYAVGSAGGVHYYAMQFIDGPTLADVVAHLRGNDEGRRTNDEGMTKPEYRRTTDEGGTPVEPAALRPSAFGLLSSFDIRHSSFPREVARLGVQAAEALHHAHEQGVLHRDVKPSNLILDGGGRLWVADFGLARLANDVRLTRTGDIIGTLRYLSPEQSRGAPADYRADVYALGVTLYEFLALEPPFASEDRHQLLRQIGADEPKPPSRLNPRVPRDLETVVLKAMAKDPAERYATARELADDLERFLAGRPVVARRPGPFDRAVKWAARNRVLVTTALAGLLLAVTALGVGLWREARMRRLEEMRARELRDAYDDIYSYVTDRWLYRQPRLEPDQRRVLEKMLTAYESFLRRWDDDPAVREKGAKVYRRVGDLRRKLGLDGAEAAYFEAIRLLGAAAGQEARYELAGCHNNLAHVWQAAGRLADAESAYAEAGRLFGELARDAPKVSEHWDGLAGTTMNLGLVRRRLGRPREAEEPLRDAVTVLRRVAVEFPEAPAYERGLAAGLSNLGDLYREAGRPGEAEPLYREAIRRQEALLGRHPSEPDFRELHGTTCHGLGLLLAAAGKPDEATAVLDKAADVRRRLAADFPLVAEYRRDLDATRRARDDVRARHTP